MALQFLDGFEGLDVYGSTGTTLENNLKLKYLDADITSFHNPPGLINDRFATGLALRWDASPGKWFKIAITGSPTTLVIGFALRLAKFTSTRGDLVVLRNSGDQEISNIGLDNYNRLLVQQGTTTLCTYDKPLTIDTWYYIEWKIYSHPSAGSSEVRVNGEYVVSISGVDTESNSGPVEYLQFPAFPGDVVIDDIYVVDNTGTNSTFLGPGIVESLEPNADTLENDFAPNTGTDNYAMIDEIPCDLAATYIEASPVGYKDRCDYPSLSVINDDVYAVMVWTVAAATTGSYTLKVSAHDGTTRDTDAGSTVNSVTYSGFLRTLDQTPSAASWTVALVNGSSFGSEVG